MLFSHLMRVPKAMFVSEREKAVVDDRAYRPASKWRLARKSEDVVEVLDIAEPEVESKLVSEES